MDPEDELAPAPTEIDPYTVLGVLNTASATEIRFAYRKLALTVHPDKVKPEDRNSAHTKFQELALAFAVLSNEKRRKRYDETGSTTESALGDESFDWNGFFHEQFKDVVTVQAVNQFKSQYQGSAEERNAVLGAYTKHRGSLDGVFSEIMASSILDDEARFRSIIDEAIASGDIKPFKGYTHESERAKANRRRKAVRERDEADKLAKQLRVHGKLWGSTSDTASQPPIEHDDSSGLQNIIKQQSANRMDDLVRTLEAKYGSGAKGSKRKAKRVRPIEEPTEEEFLAAQAKLVSDGSTKTSSRWSKRMRM